MQYALHAEFMLALPARLFRIGRSMDKWLRARYLVDAASPLVRVTLVALSVVSYFTDVGLLLPRCPFEETEEFL